jgi:NhaP-type Na+/H+ or K+/H+ antiporter
MNISVVLIGLGLVIFFSHIFTVFFEKTRIPNVMLLMLIGILIGPILKIVLPSDLGEFGSVFTSIALISILFESGTSLNLSMLKSSITKATIMTVLNFVLSLGIGYILGKYLLHINTLHSLFLGAALGGTSSAVVIPMISQLKPGEKSGTILYLESAISDIFCLVVALALMGGIETGEISIMGIIKHMGVSMLFAIFMGIVFGVAWFLVLRKFLSTMKNSMFTTFALAFIIYGLAESMGLNGGLAILAFGITVGNVGHVSFIQSFIYEEESVELRDTEKNFYGEIVFILQTYFFVYIGMSMQLNNMLHILVGLVFVALSFSGRIATVGLINRGEFERRDTRLMRTLGPKGLVAAVLASLPLQRAMSATGGVMPIGLDMEAEEMMRSALAIQNVAYSVVLISIVICSLMVIFGERRCNKL